jgi:hypothetical protein
MTKPLLILLFVFGLALAQDTEAQNTERPMTTEEFTTMLLGNTLIGEWAGSPYRQFFDRGGNTIYIGDDGSRSQGYWRIRDDGYYCSTWPPGQRESCYKVTLLADQLLWYSGDQRYPSHVVEGNQLSE